jgi:hypothetical protein
MAEDPQPGPVSLQRRPAIGERLAMGFLGTLRTLLFFPAVGLFLAALVVMLTVCFVEEPLWPSILWFFITLGAAELLIAMAAGAKWIEDVIRARRDDPDGKMADPLETAGQLVVMMIEIVLVLSGFALLLWIPAEISRERDLGVAWPALWLLVGGLAWWARREVTKRLERRAVSPDTDPCSTPEIPPSGEP